MAFYGVGYNSGKFGFQASKKVGGKWTSLHVYSVWSSMIKRCYSGAREYVVYMDVTVCDDWKDYQEFASWYYSHPHYTEFTEYQLDKDIINPNARVYSPETCRFVPKKINLLIKKMGERDYVQGVNYHKRDKAFRAFVVDAEGLHKEKNGFKSELDAFLWYKLEKEIVVKQLAEKYKSLIDLDVYEALINYKVISERFIDVS